MARQTKQDKLVETLIEHAYYKHGQNVQIDVMNISKVYGDAKAAVASYSYTHPNLQETIEKSVIASIAKYREN